MCSGKVFLGLFAGAALGATLGILFAPDKGSVTRKKIAQRSNNYVDELEDKFNDFIDSVTNEYETLREEAIRVAENEELKEDEAKA